MTRIERHEDYYNDALAVRGHRATQLCLLSAIYWLLREWRSEIDMCGHGARGWCRWCARNIQAGQDPA